jgi:hypothetical protein
MRFLAKSLCTIAAILTLALPAAAGETPAEQASGKVPDCLVKVESPIQHTPTLTSASFPNSSERSTAAASESEMDPAMAAWLARLDANGPVKSACCCGISYPETMSISCGGGRACQYRRTCTTCYGCGSWSLTSMGGCGGCPLP